MYIFLKDDEILSLIFITRNYRVFEVKKLTCYLIFNFCFIAFKIERRLERETEKERERKSM